MLRTSVSALRFKNIISHGFLRASPHSVFTLCTARDAALANALSQSSSSHLKGSEYTELSKGGHVCHFKEV